MCWTVGRLEAEINKKPSDQKQIASIRRLLLHNYLYRFYPQREAPQLVQIKQPS